VWVEVFLAGEGWLALDPTCTWFGTSIDYVPWLRTDDGHMPVVYVSLPTFERL
jgi:transglutaminase-like putative cysteine protease